MRDLEHIKETTDSTEAHVSADADLEELQHERDRLGYRATLKPTCVCFFCRQIKDGFAENLPWG